MYIINNKPFSLTVFSFVIQLIKDLLKDTVRAKFYYPSVRLLDMLKRSLSRAEESNMSKEFLHEPQEVLTRIERKIAEVGLLVVAKKKKRKTYIGPATINLLITIKYDVILKELK